MKKDYYCTESYRPAATKGKARTWGCNNTFEKKVCNLKDISKITY